MQFTAAIATAVLAFASSAVAAPLEARQAALENWKVTGVASNTPSGRPGSYPWATITASVTDPNEINLGPAKSDGTDVIVPAGSQGIVSISNHLSWVFSAPSVGSCYSQLTNVAELPG